MRRRLVPTADNSLTKEKLSNVQTAPILEPFVSVTPKVVTCEDLSPSLRVKNFALSIDSLRDRILAVC